MYNIILNNISKQERQKLIDDVNQLLEFAAKNKKIRKTQTKQERIWYNVHESIKQCGR